MGISSLLADALSMGVGDALSSKAETEVARREREREVWELENFKEGEVKEMVEIYMKRGMNLQDAEQVLASGALCRRPLLTARSVRAGDPHLRQIRGVVRRHDAGRRAGAGAARRRHAVEGQPPLALRPTSGAPPSRPAHPLLPRSSIEHAAL